MTIGERLAQLIEWHIDGRPEQEPEILRTLSPEERARTLDALDGFITTVGERAKQYAQVLATTPVRGESPAYVDVT